MAEACRLQCSVLWSCLLSTSLPLSGLKLPHSGQGPPDTSIPWFSALALHLAGMCLGALVYFLWNFFFLHNMRTRLPVLSRLEGYGQGQVKSLQPISVGHLTNCQGTCSKHLYPMAHLNLTTILWGSCDYHLYLLDEEIKAISPTRSQVMNPDSLAAEPLEYATICLLGQSGRKQIYFTVCDILWSTLLPCSQ